LNHFGIEGDLGRPDPFAGLDSGARFPGLDRTTGLFRREGHEPAGHGGRHGCHAERHGPVSVLAVPDIVLDVVEEFIGKLATTYGRHFGLLEGQAMPGCTFASC
jgi:hypothetical protein